MVRIGWILLLLVCSINSYAQDKSSKEDATVLLLNSYHPQYRWTEQLTRGVQSTLDGTVASESLHIEFMDSRRFVDDDSYHQKLIDLLNHKYQQYKPDVIITSDDHAYYFLIEHGESLFPGVPIVFSGVNVFYPETLIGKNNITGIQEGMEIKGNLELIMQLQPKTKKIIMLGDTTGLGLRMVQRAKSIKVLWQSDVDKQNISLEVWDSFTLEQLMNRAQLVEDDSVFLMLAIHKDKEGNYFSFDKDLPELARLSKAPIYGMWGALMIENGAVGGMMNDPFQHGQAAAAIALNIISGTSVSSIKIQRKATYTPVFDYKQLQRFNIELDRLPLDSKVINKPISLYAQHSELINGIVVIFIFLNVVISLLLINIRQRRVAQHKLKQFNLKLESKVKQRTKDLLARNDELEAVSKRMEKMANTDLLTGLSNRRAAKREVEAFIKRFNIDFQPLTLGILDVDYFKKINDSFGHQIGDEVLCELANTLTTTLRPSDRVYRWGGEEFLIALPNAELETAYAVCQRLKSKISQFQVADVGVVTVSIGLANFKTNNTFDHIIQHADSALYDAKNQGRDRVVMAR